MRMLHERKVFRLFCSGSNDVRTGAEPHTDDRWRRTIVAAFVLVARGDDRVRQPGHHRGQISSIFAAHRPFELLAIARISSIRYTMATDVTAYVSYYSRSMSPGAQKDDGLLFDCVKFHWISTPPTGSSRLTRATCGGIS